jgi:hypothetical protein
MKTPNRLMRDVAACIVALCGDPEPDSWAKFATMLTSNEDYGASAAGLAAGAVSTASNAWKQVRRARS